MKSRMWMTGALFLALATGPAAATEPAELASSMSDLEYRLLNTEAMLGAHPDYRWRREGLLAIEQGRQDLARIYLKRAARYADKPAQALIAERYWKGEGVAQDRALAYAWMDLAAERGYTVFLVHRENYWDALTAAERERALRVGQDVYAEYGDSVAQPRLSLVLKNRHRAKTGSRSGSSNFVQVFEAPSHNPSGGNGIGRHGTSQFYRGAWLPNYYQPKLWVPERYWDWQNDLYRGLPEGIVRIGELSRGDGSDDKPATD